MLSGTSNQDQFPDVTGRLVWLCHLGLLELNGNTICSANILRMASMAGARLVPVAFERRHVLADNERRRALGEQFARWGIPEPFYVPRTLPGLYRVTRWLRRLPQQELPAATVLTQTACAMPAIAAHDRRGVPILWDMRAALRKDVVAYWGGQLLRSRLLGPLARYYERAVIRRVAAIRCVSEALGRYCDEQFDRRVPSFAVPNVADATLFRYDPEARRVARKRLGLTERFVLIFAGGTYHWQCIDEMLALFRELKRDVPEAFLLMLTPQQSAFAEKLCDAGIGADDVLLTCVPHTEVPSIMVAADAGMLLLRRGLRNTVAWPTRFAEYLACGVPTVIGPEVGECSAWVEENQLGLICDPGKPDSWPEVIAGLAKWAARRTPEAHSDQETLRQRCRDFAERHLSIEANAPRIGEWLRNSAPSCFA